MVNGLRIRSTNSLVPPLGKNNVHITSKNFVGNLLENCQLKTLRKIESIVEHNFHIPIIQMLTIITHFLYFALSVFKFFKLFQVNTHFPPTHPPPLQEASDPWRHDT